MMLKTVKKMLQILYDILIRPNKNLILKIIDYNLFQIMTRIVGKDTKERLGDAVKLFQC